MSKRITMPLWLITLPAGQYTVMQLIWHSERTASTICTDLKRAKLDKIKKGKFVIYIWPGVDNYVKRRNSE